MPIRRYAERSIGHDHADDVVSETFIVVWRRWSDAPASSGLRRAWTFKVAHNVVAHHVRSQVRRGQLFRRVASLRPAADSGSYDAVAEEQQVAQVLSGLPLGEREALALVVWGDMSPQQAAFALGCSVTALHSRLSRARKRLIETSTFAVGDRQEVIS